MVAWAYLTRGCVQIGGKFVRKCLNWERTMTEATKKYKKKEAGTGCKAHALLRLKFLNVLFYFSGFCDTGVVELSTESQFQF